MCLFDTVVLVIVYIQPPVMGVLLALRFRPGLIDTAWWARSLGIRQRQKSTRFFECAAYSRLSGWVRYGTQSLALCAVFLLYDVDLVFFFTEVTAFEQ
jgi:NADH:ubiquinone oxidoreductase subunit 3 (subunit A)